MNICFMNSIKGWGGGEKWHFENAIECMNQGYNVYFIVNKNSKLLDKLQKYPKIKIFDFTLSKRSYLNPFMILNLYRFFKQNSIDILFFNSIRDMNTGSFSAHKAKVRKIILRYGWDHKVKQKIHTKLSFKYFITDVFANSNWVKKRLLETNYLKSSQIMVLNNGVKFNQKSIKPFSSKSEIVLGFAGRLTFEKGIKPLLEVMEKLRDKPIKLLLAGTGPDEEKIRSIIEKNNLITSVEMLGFVSNMEDFYSEIDILMHLTYADGISNTVIEAMVSKKPIISFNVASMPEIIIDGVNGFLVPLNNLNEVVNSIIKLYSQQELIVLFGQNSFNLAEEKFNFKKNFNILKTNFLAPVP